MRETTVFPRLSAGQAAPPPTSRPALEATHRDVRGFEAARVVGVLYHSQVMSLRIQMPAQCVLPEVK